LPGATLVEKVKTFEWKDAVRTANPQPGIAYKYYQPEQHINMVSSFKTNLINSGVVDVISVAKKQRTDKFAFEFNGYLKITKDGIYNFFTQSDDGSKLFIDEEEVVDNDGDHGTVEKNGKAGLKKGYHKIRVIYFDSGGGNELKVLIQVEGGNKEEVSGAVLFH
jgi:PA14 domain